MIDEVPRIFVGRTSCMLNIRNSLRYRSSTAISKKNYGKLIGAYLYLRSISAARPLVLLDWLDLDCLFRRAGLVGATRVGLVARRLTDRANASELSKRSMPSRARSFSVNLIVFLSVPVVSTSR